MTKLSNSKDHPRLAIAARIGYALGYSAMTAFAKSAAIDGANAAEILFYRNAFALPVVLAWVMMGPGLASVKTSRPKAHVSRAVIGFISMAATFVSVTLLPLAEMTIIYFLTPLIATGLSALWLHDRIGWHRWAAIGVGFTGVIILCGPALRGHLPILGVAIALSGTFMLACVAITVRQLGSTEPATTTVFWFVVFSTVVSGLALPFFAQAHDPAVWMKMIVMGVVGAFMQILMTASLNLAPVSVTAPFDYTQLVFATVLGWLLFSYIPGVSTFLGALLIVGAGLYTVYREHLRRRSIAAAAGSIVT